MDTGRQETYFSGNQGKTTKQDHGGHRMMISQNSGFPGLIDSGLM